jgi:hypothetical protein
MIFAAVRPSGRTRNLAVADLCLKGKFLQYPKCERCRRYRLIGKCLALETRAFWRLRYKQLLTKSLAALGAFISKETGGLR